MAACRSVGTLLRSTLMMSHADQRERPFVRPVVDLTRTPHVVDLFCGCGGASAGFRAAGMDITAGLDNDPDAARTFRANFPAAAFIADDIRTVPTASLDAVVDGAPRQPMLLSACAPCQPFSKQHQREPFPGDARNVLALHIIRFVQRYRPEVIFSENVPGMSDQRQGGAVFSQLVQGLRDLGYATIHEVIRCQDYGVPQRRSRLVLVASRLGPLTWPEPSYGTSAGADYASVADWISGLPAVAAGETHPVIPNHQAARLSALNLRRIRATPAGGGWRDLPHDLRPPSRRAGFGGYTDVYGRLKWDAPAPALTTRCISYSNGRYGHPAQDRAITVREAALLQTLPSDFVLTGTLNAQARQVGNAVPALLAQKFGEHLMQHLAESVS